MPSLEHPEISAISFVGSTATAKAIYAKAAANGKRVSVSRWCEKIH